MRDSFDLPPIDPLPPNLTDESVTDDEQPHRPPQLTLTRSLSNGNGGDGMPITLIPPSPRESGDAESVYTLRNDKEGEPEVSKRKKAQQKAQRIIKEQVEKRQSQIQTISRKLGRSGTMRSNISRVSRHSSTPGQLLILLLKRSLTGGRLQCVVSGEPFIPSILDTLAGSSHISTRVVHWPTCAKFHIHSTASRTNCNAFCENAEGETTTFRFMAHVCCNLPTYGEIRRLKSRHSGCREAR